MAIKNEDRKFDYNEVFSVLQKELSLYLKSEEGNKISSYSIEGLIHKIMSEFDMLRSKEASNDRVDKKG